MKKKHRRKLAQAAPAPVAVPEPVVPETRAPGLWLPRLEWAAAFAIAAVICVLHVVNMRHAGGLWRDEAAAVHLAQMSSFGEVWAHIEHESFPLLVTMLLRAWSAVGLGDSDPGLRALGLVIGIAALAALWFAAWRFSRAAPLIALLLFALNPTAVRWGDSLRAYGLGVLFIVVTAALVWSFAQSGQRRTLLVAMASGVLAVQSLYQNAFMLAVICAAAVAVALLRRDVRRALLVVAAGVPAMLSLLPYIGVVRRANEWNMATQTPVDLARIWTVLHRALSAPNALMLWLWAALLVLAIIAAGLLLFAKRERDATDAPPREVACFHLTLIVGVSVAYYLFLTKMKFPSEVWYYLVWMALVAVAVDALIARAFRNSWLRWARLALVVSAAAALVPAAWPRLQIRMTNLDLVAERLNTTTVSGDLIVVQPWFCAVSFKRYYNGAAEVTTLPPLADYRLQRLDLFKAQIAGDDPVRPAIDKIETTLRSGNTVWLVGYFPFTNPPQPPPIMPRGGEGPERWRGAPYMSAYGMEAAYFIQMHATRSSAVEVPVEQPVNPFEDLPVRAISGWRYGR